jgi:ABC-type transporter Mla MlaB component
MATSLHLPAELTIYTVGELRSTWLAWLGDAVAGDDAGAVLHADAAAVDQVDGAGVQLLLSLANALAAHGRPFRLDQPSAPLVQACEWLGAGTLLSGHAAEAAA